MFWKWLIVVFIVFYYMVSVESGITETTNSQALYDYIVSAQNKNVRPCTGCVTPLIINITFHLTSLNDLDEVRGEMNSIGYLTVTWYDDRLMWNPATYGYIYTMMFPPDTIWTPTILVGNPSRKISTIQRDAVPVRAVYDGKVIWNPGEVFLTKCYPNIYKYPYDAQECYISIVPWGILPTELLLKCPIETIFTPHYVDNGEWVLHNTKATDYVENGLPVAKFIFTFKRRPQFFVVNVILPIILLSYLNCIVFFIPTESGERVSYAITVLLSFAVFMTLVSDNIPKTSDPMSLLCYYLISVFSGSALVMVVTIFIMSIFYRDPSTPVTAKYRRLVRLTTKEFRKNKPARPASTPINVVSVQPSDGEIKKKLYIRSHSRAYSRQEKNSPEKTEQRTDTSDITWKDVANAMDILALFGFFTYFTASTVIQLMFIAIP